MLFLQNEGVNPAGRQHSSMAWSRALRATDSASRIPPLKIFDGGKHGRTHQFHKAMAFDQKFYGQICLSDCWQIFVRLLRSGEVEPCPCLPRCQYWEEREFLGADITAGTVAKYRRASVDFKLFIVVKVPEHVLVMTKSHSS